MDAVKDWLSLAALLISVGGVVYAWLTAASKANTGALSQVNAKIADHAARVAAVEFELKHLPDKESVHRLELAMADMKGQLSTLSSASDGTHRALLRMEDFLMNRDKS